MGTIRYLWGGIVFLIVLLSCARAGMEWRLQDGSQIVASAALYDFGTISANTRVTKGFTISNPGIRKFTAMAPASAGIDGPFAFAGTAGTYPGEGGTCADTLDPGADCTVVISFTPMRSGTFSSALVLQYDDGTAKTLLRAFTGTANDVSPVYRHSIASFDTVLTLASDPPAGFTKEGVRLYVYNQSGVCTSPLLRCTYTGPGGKKHYSAVDRCPNELDTEPLLGYICPASNQPEGTMPIYRAVIVTNLDGVRIVLAGSQDVANFFQVTSIWESEGLLGHAPVQ